MNLEELTERVEALEATRVAFMVVLAALIRHQPDYDRTQLFLTSHLEQQLNGGALGRTLNGRQLHYAREVVEWLQTIKPPSAQSATSSIDRFRGAAKE